MSETILQISDGRLKGIETKDYLGNKFYSFLGIPYGKPPIGNLRFKAPQPADPWDGILDATREGPECPSYHMILGHFVGNEDNCLHLNVYTKQLPENNETCLKPVMVWIHGGGFYSGSNKREFFGPDYLITEDIVLVTINYRLGMFGFLCLEDPSLEVPGNAGFKDQVLALRWVQKNVSYFGGDPKNVTIFGESAGAGSVHLLCLSPMARGLFHRAIIQSGCALNPWAKSRPNGKEHATFLNYAESDERKLLEYFKNLPAEKIVKAQQRNAGQLDANQLRSVGVVIEPSDDKDAFLSAEPTEIIKSGNFSNVPIIIGYASNEGIFFNLMRRSSIQSKIRDNCENEIHHELDLKQGSDESKNIASKIQQFYLNGEKPSEKNIEKLYTQKTDSQFLYGIHRSIQFQKEVCAAPIYLYRMSLVTSLNFYKILATVKYPVCLYLCYAAIYKLGDGMVKDILSALTNIIPRATPPGACHADDLGYLFKLFVSSNPSPGSIEALSIKRFVKLWTNFAKTGNPTPNKDNLFNNVEWIPVSKKKNYYLDIGKELTIGTDPEEERMQFWDSIYANV